MASINEKGITLIALVITIIVLLVLAGVSLSLVLGDNGVIKNHKLQQQRQEMLKKKRR